MRGPLEQRLEDIREIAASQRSREAFALVDAILAEGGSYELARHMDRVDWFHAAVIAQVAPPDKSLQGLVVDILKARQPYGNADEVRLAGKDAGRENPGR